MSQAQTVHINASHLVPNVTDSTAIALFFPYSFGKWLSGFSRTHKKKQLQPKIVVDDVSWFVVFFSIFVVVFFSFSSNDAAQFFITCIQILSCLLPANHPHISHQMIQESDKNVKV